MRSTIGIVFCLHCYHWRLFRKSNEAVHVGLWTRAADCQLICAIRFTPAVPELVSLQTSYFCLFPAWFSAAYQQHHDLQLRVADAMESFQYQSPDGSYGHQQLTGPGYQEQSGPGWQQRQSVHTEIIGMPQQQPPPPAPAPAPQPIVMNNVVSQQQQSGGGGVVVGKLSSCPSHVAWHESFFV